MERRSFFFTRHEYIQGGIEGQLHPLVIRVLDRGKCCCSQQSPLCQLNSRLNGSRTRLEPLEKEKKFCLCTGPNRDSKVFQFLTRKVL
jgi:hypothetical protein